MEKLGLELPLLITQVVNFAILVFLLQKLLYKPVLKILEERRKKVEEGIELSAKAKEELQNAQNESATIIKKASLEAVNILNEAKKEASLEKQKIVESGKKEITNLRAKHEEELAERYTELSQQVSKDVIAIATVMVQKLLPNLLNEKDRKKLFDQNLEKLKATHER
ncbi:ATP synthase F0 subunit B [Candidatus Woesebacteria bacterium RIFCSPHIGHO2_02_FULL_38_9]|uniref:ATP synthase subunit b n=1 Tax=Candidatus Woesebacteria bacterium RIFCSPHIGHO2_01_FULL_39_28 TaxID=1802496 RepID=A0A1F7YCD3_9BACT|nr:MAG: ATP synthase F0 subunit B [Candidatus Woesebacteria bacterium RIFCSPHIGHO2_01_FULL_39_28]OGM33945.1 MAG: ATP synthase F0 subunit B [Candidatus Woesebacteria bacterium RIFCSPHIGHO2_02_FULL_38_9]OGM57543.1 MAG: ATP synthase F0 subunit B [Candidatus Woesebacteria bacterium RIFCSPLOWO2_01_FULL_38_20]